MRIQVAFRSANGRFVVASLMLLGYAALANAAPPKVTSFFPAGVARGSQVKITAAGEFSPWPVQAVASHAGLKIEPAKESGHLTIEAAADCPPGLHYVRLFNAEGAAAQRPFMVGTLAESNEKEPNDGLAGAQAVELPRVINGRVVSKSGGKGGDTDVYRVTLKRGETLVAAVDANSALGSPVDAAMQVTLPSGIVLAQNHDEVGMDPRITFTAPADGEYFVRLFGFPAVPDSRVGIAGGEGFIYRLTLTAAGFLDYTLPLSATRGQQATLELLGVNIPEAQRWLTITPESDTLQVFQPTLAGGLMLPVVDLPSLREAEPNEPSQPQQVTLPAVISGRLDAAKDVDAFAFTAKAKERWMFRVAARALGFPIDPTLRIADTTGKMLSQIDDTAKERDAELLFVCPADGQYQIQVRDLHRRGGERFAYRLEAEPAGTAFSLSVAADQFTIAAGKPLEIMVQVNRPIGLTESIEITAADLPLGVTAETVASEGKGATAKTVKLVLKAGDAAVQGPLTIVGKLASSGTTRRAETALVNGQSSSSFWVTALAKDASKEKDDGKEKDAAKK